MGSSFGKIYQDMRERNLKKIRSNGLTFDPLLLTEKISPRKSLCLFAFFSRDSESRINQLAEEAKLQFPDQIVYDAISSNKILHGLVHCTFLQLVRTGNVNYPLRSDAIEKYVETIDDAVLATDPFDIRYQGVVGLPGNIVITGYPSIDINVSRQKVRDAVKQAQLFYDEPYLSDTAHSTIVRFGKREDPRKVVDFAHSHQDIFLDTLTIDKLYLGYGTWKMNLNETEMLYEFDLRKKIMKKNTKD